MVQWSLCEKQDIIKVVEWGGGLALKSAKGVGPRTNSGLANVVR